MTQDMVHSRTRQFKHVEGNETLMTDYEKQNIKILKNSNM